MDEWDPGIPGSGASRVRGLCQFYFRFAAYPSGVVVIGDALCVVFGKSGATLSELTVYTNLPERILQQALEIIPKSICCCSLDGQWVAKNSEDEWGDETAKKTTTKVPQSLRFPLPTSSSPALVSSSSRLRYYINYRTTIPFIYAHVSRILLGLCLQFLPHERDRKENENPKTFSYSSHGPISSTLRQTGALEGICCPSCMSWWDISEVGPSISKGTPSSFSSGAENHNYPGAAGKGRHEKLLSTCRACGDDILSTTLDQLIRLPSSTCFALKEDPYLIQSALAFRWLTSSCFCTTETSLLITDPECYMTKEELSYRQQHLSLATQQLHRFRRLRQSQEGGIRIQLISQEHQEAQRVRRNRLKIQRRELLPSWLSSVASTSSIASFSTLASPHHERKIRGKKLSLKERTDLHEEEGNSKVDVCGSKSSLSAFYPSFDSFNNKYTISENSSLSLLPADSSEIKKTPANEEIKTLQNSFLSEDDDFEVVYSASLSEVIS